MTSTERRGHARFHPWPAPLAARLAAFATAALSLALWLAPQSAEAHAIGLSRGDYCLHQGRLDANLVFSRTEVAELELARNIAVSTGSGTPCTASAPRLGTEENDGLTVGLTFDCPLPAEKVTVDLGLLDELAFGHRHVANIASGAAREVHLAFRSSRSFAVPENTAACAAGAGSVNAAPSLFGFMVLGIEHILTGYDHLVFLLGVILVGGRVRALLGVVTAFTIGHSITLALAALDVFTPGAWLVEAGIALSIAWVGLENFWVENAEKRWRLTLPFGLLHGFGFAGVLRDIGLPEGQVAGALVSFNLGVEAGQMVVMAFALPLVVWALRKPWFGTRGVKVVSGVIVVAGVFWFAQRTLGA